MSNINNTLTATKNFIFNYENLPHPTTRPGEVEFLNEYDPTKYGLAPEDVVLTADACVFTVTEGTMKVLLIERANHPYKGFWCLPGGFVDTADGNPKVSAVRELEEETGVTNLHATFVKVYQHPWRDPRFRNGITFAYAFFVTEEVLAEGADDAVTAKWVNVDDVLNNDIPVGFDHKLIIVDAIKTVF